MVNVIIITVIIIIIVRIHGEVGRCTVIIIIVCVCIHGEVGRCTCVCGCTQAGRRQASVTFCQGLSLAWNFTEEVGELPQV